MKTLILSLVAAAALGVALPAAAHEDDYQRPSSDWNYNSAFGGFSDDVAHIQEGIQHGLSDGSYTRWQAMRFSRELRSIERQIVGYNESDGDINPWERSMIQRRLDRLHSIMHVVHDEGHEQQYQGYGNYGNYGGYGGYGDRR